MQVHSPRRENGQDVIVESNQANNSLKPDIANFKNGHSKALATFRFATLAVILLAALRIICCPKPLSGSELDFLKWALIVATILLGASEVIKRSLLKQLLKKEDSDFSEE